MCAGQTQTTYIYMGLTVATLALRFRLHVDPRHNGGTHEHDEILSQWLKYKVHALPYDLNPNPFVTLPAHLPRLW